ncbi:MAG: sulfite exporter TauE/SafE family protein, partial [Antricoccus sp.]
VYLLDQSPGSATTSSLLIVGVRSLIALIPHARAGRVRVGQGLTFGLLGTAGSFAGSKLSVKVSPPVLLAAFAILMLLVAVLMVRTAARPTAVAVPGQDSTDDVAQDSPQQSFWHDGRRMVKLIGTATAVGFLTGFFGVGGGFALVPALVLALDFPMPVAVGTSLLVIAINSATALAARAQLIGGLDWGLIATFTGAAVIGSLLGSRVVARVSPVRLRQTFAALLLLVALYTGFQSFTTLLSH